MDKQNPVISYVTLGVTDLETMQAFYSGFGFELYAQSDNIDHPFTLYKSGSLILALYPKHLLATQAACIIDDSDSNNAMSLSLNVANKESVDHYLEKAKQLNAVITKEGFIPAWGGYCAYFKDPENNLWEIAWHEKFVFLV